MVNTLVSMLCCLVNVVCYSLAQVTHTLAIVYLIRNKVNYERIIGVAEGIARPWYPFYVFAFSIFTSYYYMCTADSNTFINALFNSSFWASVIIVYDFYMCFFPKKGRGEKLNRLYIDEQPWTALKYAAILLGALLAYFLVDIDVFVEEFYRTCPLFDFL